MSTVAIHGNNTQNAPALVNVKRGQVSVLVVADIASRGLPVNGLGNVVDVELPNVAHDYVHLIGWAGVCDDLVSLLSYDEVPQLRAID